MLLTNTIVYNADVERKKSNKEAKTKKVLSKDKKRRKRPNRVTCAMPQSDLLLICVRDLT